MLELTLNSIKHFGFKVSETSPEESELESPEKEMKMIANPETNGILSFSTSMLKISTESSPKRPKFRLDSL